MIHFTVICSRNTFPSRTRLGVLHRVIDVVRKFGEFLTELHWAAETAVRGWKCN